MAQLSAQGPIAFAHATTETVTSAAHVVGTRGYDSNGNEYRYVKFTDAVGAGGWTVIDGAWNARRVVTADRGALGISQTSVAASAFGWVKVYGIEDVAQVTSGDSAATSTYILTAPTGVTSKPTISAQATSANVTNPVFGARIVAAASTATTGTSSSFSGTTVQVFLNYPFLNGLNVDVTS